MGVTKLSFVLIDRSKFSNIVARHIRKRLFPICLSVIDFTALIYLERGNLFRFSTLSCRCFAILLIGNERHRVWNYKLGEICWVSEFFKWDKGVFSGMKLKICTTLDVGRDSRLHECRRRIYFENLRGVGCSTLKRMEWKSKFEIVKNLSFLECCTCRRGAWNV